MASLEEKISKIKNDMNQEENYRNLAKINSLARMLEDSEKEKEEAENLWLEKSELL